VISSRGSAPGLRDWRDELTGGAARGGDRIIMVDGDGGERGGFFSGGNALRLWNICVGIYVQIRMSFCCKSMGVIWAEFKVVRDGRFCLNGLVRVAFVLLDTR